MKAYILFIPLLLACSGTNTDDRHITEIASLSLNEISGMEYMNGEEIIWTLQDKGNQSIVYGFDRKGNIAKEVEVNTENNDWESLASDSQGNLYIGNFGNNNNDRRDLVIYKVNKADLKGGKVNAASAINFSYPEQKDFPPGKSERLYDCEAFFELNGNFYLFTKNRSSNSDGSFYVYTVPNKAGNHNAKRIGTLKTCKGRACQVTGADISPDGKLAALITEDKIFLLTGFDNDNFNSAKVESLELGHSSQKEGICFTDNNTLLITDERSKKSGGNLYEVKLSDLKGKI